MNSNSRKSMIHGRLRALAWLVTLLGMLGAGTAAAADRSLDNIEYQAMPGDRVLITLTLSGEAPEPVVFTVDRPARVALDLPDTRVALANRYSRINIGNTRAVAAAEAKGRSRVVVELVQQTPYTVTTQGNKIFVQIGAGSDTALAPAAPVTDSGTAVPSVAPLRRTGDGISKIDFRRGEKGEALVIISLTNPGTPVNIKEQGGKVIAEFMNTSLPENLIKRLDVLDFATPAKYIDANRAGSMATVTVTTSAGAQFEQIAYQTGNLFTLELQPLTPEKVAEQQARAPKYTGERISLNFQSVDVRALLQIIADVAGVNMVVSDSVRGEVAMRLQNVPWDQALDIILTTKNLGKQQEGNVILVAPNNEIAAREKAALEAAQAQVVLEPLRSEIIQINYAKATEIAEILRSKDNSLLSERGRISVDERTNTLLVLETRGKIDDMRKVVAQLDIPVKQVLIESRIVIANDDYSRDLGARFGVTTQGGVNTTDLFTTGSATGADNLANGVFPALNDRFNVNLPAAPAAGNAGRIALAILGADYLIDLELSALQTEGRGEIVSTPRVVTANGKEANIEQGVEIPYQESSASGATSISFKEAVLSLKVTPQITPDDHVIMDLDINNDTVGQVVSDTLGGSIPSIDTRKLSTQVLVDNGETVVLGGIFEQTNRNNSSKIPLFGDIPLLGNLFKSKAQTSNKRELLVFITPRILKEGLKINQN